jgi:histidine ammonia-lyase
VRAYRVVLACELVAAVRALRMRGVRPVGRALASVFDRADVTLPASVADRPLDGDLAAAEELLDAAAGAIDADW